MGHKIHPLIFRSKIFPFYSNIWPINSTFNKHINNVYNINISNINNILEIKYFSFLKNQYIYNIILNEYNNSIYKSIIQKFLNLKHIYIQFCVLKNPLLSTNYILTNIINQIKKKKYTRKFIKSYMLNIYNSGSNLSYKIYGIKIIISGRINGAQKTKIETFKYNNVSLNSFNVYVKYNTKYLKTKYGILGFKIWLFLK